MESDILVDHDDVIKWKHFPRYWPFVQGIHQSMVNSPHQSQWCVALVFTLICARINGWVNNHEPGDLKRHRTHYDLIVMHCFIKWHGAWQAPRYRPSQSWFIDNLTLRNKVQTCDQCTHICTAQDNAFQTVVCQMRAFLFGTYWDLEFHSAGYSAFLFFW